MLGYTKFIDPVARALMAAIFILSALGKLGAPAATQGYMAANGLPGALLWPTIAFEFAGGMLLLVGLFTRPVALLLAVFSLVTAFIFHDQFADQIQMVMFLKNAAITGGLLMLARCEVTRFSVDALRAGKAMVHA
jgi:putative oxidoreductase